MRPDLILLCFAYVLSQFYRSFLAVLTGPLERDLGANAADLALASGVWFLIFALMQIPVGVALDRIGPRRSSSVLLLLGGAGGALVFALATEVWHITLAMALLGIGCSNVLMAAFYIFARVYSAGRFATLAALFLGVGTLGNILGALPMSLAAETLGWRGAMLGMAGISAITAIGVFVTLRDPPGVVSETRGSLFDLLRVPGFWMLIPITMACYAPAAGIRGLWVGPWFADVQGADATRVGQVALVMGIAMILGTFAYGPLDRLLGTRKWVVFGGNLAALCCLVLLLALPGIALIPAVALFAAIGFFSSSYPMVMAHGRAFFPPHLVGRGVTLMNLLSLGAVGAAQVATGRLQAWGAARPGIEPAAAYAPVLWLYVALLAVGLVVYGFSRDRMD